MTPVEKYMICAEQKKDATMQLLIQEFALVVAHMLQRGVSSPQNIGL